MRKNELLIEEIKKDSKSISVFCRQNGLDPERIRKFLNGRLAKGLRPFEIIRISDALKIDPCRWEMYFDQIPDELEETFIRDLTKLVEKCVFQHERHRGSYFWTPHSKAIERRIEEEKNTWAEVFVYDSVEYRYSSNVQCSCRNYYYKGTFIVNGKKKDLRSFNKLLKILYSRIETIKAA